MKIIWRDTSLESHEIDLTNAVDVKINGIAISIDNEYLDIRTNHNLVVKPSAANSIKVKEEL